MRYDEWIKGIFTGMLLASFFMLVAPKQAKCEVQVERGRETHVYVGSYVDY